MTISPLPAAPRAVLAPARAGWRAALRSPASPLAAVLAAALAFAYAYWMFGGPFLRGTSSFWLQQDGDIAQYLAGFNAFVREPWQWPLLHLSSINYPDGTLATFLDTVPLYALLMKLWQHGADTPFRNPYAAWIGICYALQGVGAWWICREANLRTWTALLAMTLLLASFPPLGYRINHISLMSQWLLLFGLAVYIRGTRLGRLAAPAWIALLPFAFYINIYLFVMLSLLFAADLRRARLRGAAWGTLLRAPLLAYGVLALTMCATMLPLGKGSGGGEWGFGYYSMNLLGPFSGGRLLHFKQPWAHEGQAEGFAYLGVFMLAMTTYACVLRRRHDPAFWRRHQPLAITLVLMTLYALSNIVYLSNNEVFHLDLPHWTNKLTSIMRASARFFWPVGYALMAFTVITVYRLAPPRRAGLLLVGLLCLQLWDLHPRHKANRAMAETVAPERIGAAAWDGFLGAEHRTLQVYPPFGCGKAPATTTMLPTMLYAAKRELNISTGYVARVKKPCDNYAAEIAAISADAARAASTAFVFMKADFTTVGEVRGLLGDQPGAPQCIEVDFAWLCKRASAVTMESKQ